MRADLDTSLCIQGAPGTGKTAVGLHRAAYLLYTYPERLRRSGVLVVGPNRAFLHYIAQVLPSLGEGGIEQATVDELVGVERARRPSRPTLADAQGRRADGRRAAPRRRLARRQARPTTCSSIIGTRRYRVGAHHLRRYVDDARRALGDGLRWSMARDRLRMQVAEDVRRQREDAGGAPTDAETAKIARSPAVTRVRRRGVAGADRAGPARAALRRRRLPAAVRAGTHRRRARRAAPAGPRGRAHGALDAGRHRAARRARAA